MYAILISGAAKDRQFSYLIQLIKVCLKTDLHSWQFFLHSERKPRYERSDLQSATKMLRRFTLSDSFSAVFIVTMTSSHPPLPQSMLIMSSELRFCWKLRHWKEEGSIKRGLEYHVKWIIIWIPNFLFDKMTCWNHLNYFCYWLYVHTTQSIKFTLRRVTGCLIGIF